MVYEVAVTHVERTEAQIPVHIRHTVRLGYHYVTPMLISMGIQLILTLKALTEGFNFAKPRLYLTVRPSNDPAMREVVPDIKKGRKWKLVIAESHGKQN